MKNKKKEIKPKGAENKGSSKKKVLKTPVKSKRVAKKSTKAPAKKTAKKKTASTKAPRKTRSDSVENSMAIASAALAGVAVPDGVKLKPEQIYFWNLIIEERAIVDWSNMDLAVVARLARYMANEEDLHNKIETEGYVLHKKKAIMEHGTEKIITMESYTNPRQRSLDMVSSKVIALRRSLSLHTRGKEGEARDVGKRFVDNKKQQAKIMDDDDELLASPSNTQH